MTYTLPKLANLPAGHRRLMCAESSGWRCLCGDDWIAPDEPLDASYSQELPDFDRDANAALALVEAMRKEGWLVNMQDCEEGWRAEFVRFGPGVDETTSHIGVADTLPRAIVSAFLLAKGLAR